RAEGPAVLPGVPPLGPERLPMIPPGLRSAVERRWAACSGWRRRGLTIAAWVLGLAVAALVAFAVYELARLLIAEDRTGAFTGALTTATVIGTVAALSALVGWSLRCVLDGRAKRAWASRASQDAAVVTVAALGLLVAPVWLWAARPLFH